MSLNIVGVYLDWTCCGHLVLRKIWLTSPVRRKDNIQASLQFDILKSKCLVWLNEWVLIKDYPCHFGAACISRDYWYDNGLFTSLVEMAKIHLSELLLPSSVCP